MATNDKYDRQLRLWGANGQRALMNAHILLIRGIIISSDITFNLIYNQRLIWDTVTYKYDDCILVNWSLSADSVGTETLKNLVLPGVGSFTILDDFIVDQHDLGKAGRQWRPMLLKTIISIFMLIYDWSIKFNSIQYNRLQLLHYHSIIGQAQGWGSLSAQWSNVMTDHHGGLYLYLHLDLIGRHWVAGWDESWCEGICKSC